MADFESSWGKMLDKYDMHDNSHLKLMYLKRDEWVPAYFRGTFFANMKTTQRSEEMNAVMKLLVNNHTSIYRFVLQLEKLVQDIWKTESDADCQDIIKTPQLWSWNNMEVDAHRVYTANLFALFKKILKESSNGIVVEVEREKLYEVKITCHPSFANWTPEAYLVRIDKFAENVSCNRKGFEFSELLCAHAIKVMQHIGMQNPPSKYIIKHWTKGANENVKRSITETCMVKGESVQLESMRHSTLYPKFMEILHIATKSGEAFELVDACLDEMKEKVLPMRPSTSGEQCIGEIETEVRTRCQTTAATTSSKQKISSYVEYIDPPVSQCKGKRRPQQLKPIIEQIAPKRRTCSYCNEKEGHNLRTCPKRLEDCSA